MPYIWQSDACPIPPPRIPHACPMGRHARHSELTSTHPHWFHWVLQESCPVYMTLLSDQTSHPYLETGPDNTICPYKEDDARIWKVLAFVPRVITSVTPTCATQAI